MNQLLIIILLILSICIPQDGMDGFDPLSKNEVIEVIHFAHLQRRATSSKAFDQKTSSPSIKYPVPQNAELKTEFPVITSPEIYRKLICVYLI